MSLSVSSFNPRGWWPTPLAGAVGGYLASLADWPLPWMVGSLLAVIVVRCLANRAFSELPGGRKAGQWLVASGIGLRTQATAILKDALAEGRAEIQRRLATHPSRGLEASNAQA